VNALGTLSAFSSTGPSFDGRVKPDVVAMGSSTSVGFIDGTVGTSNGTSFSAPLIAGLAAGLVQTFPRHKAQQIRQAILKSGNQFKAADMFRGFGIPNYDKASEVMELILGNEPTSNAISIYPNPINPGSPLHIVMPVNSAYVEMLNSSGEIVHSFRLEQSESTIYLGPFVSGKYYFRFTTESTTQTYPVLLL
jgi:subtilisin family serine protease